METHVWHRCNRFVALALLAFAASAPAFAENVGNVRTLQAAPARDGTPGWDITTDSGARVRVDLLRADTLRVQAGRQGKLTPAGDKAAPIVLPQPAGKVDFAFEEDAQEARIRTGELVLRIQRQPLRLSLGRVAGDQVTPLWRELQPLDLDAQQSV